MTQDNPVNPENPEDAIGAMPPDLRPLPAVLAVVGAAIAAALIFVMTSYVLVGNQVVPQLLAGVIVGCLVRFGGGGAGKPMIFIVMALAVAGQAIGFFLAEPNVFVDPTWQGSINRFFSLTGIILIALNCYVTWLIAKR